MIHVVGRQSTTLWDSIYADVISRDPAFPGDLDIATNDARPTSPNVLPQDWCAVAWTGDYGSNAVALRNAIVSTLDAGAAQHVMIDELSASTAGLVAETASLMPNTSFYWNRWGAFLVNGYNVSYSSLAPTITALFNKTAVVAPEMYPRRVDYWDSGALHTGAGTSNLTFRRDDWLRQVFDGRDTYPNPGGSAAHLQIATDRFRWLVAHRAAIQNPVGRWSMLPIIFGVQNSSISGSNSQVFLDRLFYVWVNRTAYPANLYEEVGGGAGSWNWSPSEVSNNLRDAQFVDSYRYYRVA